MDYILKAIAYFLVIELVNVYSVSGDPSIVISKPYINNDTLVMASVVSKCFHYDLDVVVIHSFRITSCYAMDIATLITFIPMIYIDSNHFGQKAMDN